MFKGEGRCDKFDHQICADGFIFGSVGCYVMPHERQDWQAVQCGCGYWNPTLTPDTAGDEVLIFGEENVEDLGNGQQGECEIVYGKGDEEIFHTFVQFLQVGVQNDKAGH